MTSVLVTGGAGYIGSHICKALRRRGIEPVVLDNLSTGHDWAVKWGPLVVGDVADPAAVASAVKGRDVGAIVHLASLAYVGDSVRNPGLYWRENVGGAAALFDAAIGAGIRKVVFSSSCTVYGIPASVPVTEGMPMQPISPYGATKATIERMLQDFRAAHGVRDIALRYFNAAGADPEAEIGEDHEPEPHLVPNILRVASGVRPSVDILGTDYETPDGTCIRDYVHVTDLADAHVRALGYLDAGGEPVQVNIGTGTGHSVLQMVEAARRTTGHAIPVNPVARRPGDPPTLVADPSRSLAVLGIKPQFSDIDTIMRTAWAWEQKRVERQAGGS